jgi:NTP pyrophosphatase (non-canonical NTP hydrolase)
VTSPFMVSRRAIVALLPLVAALIIGSVVSLVTLSWGLAFVPWQLAWWAFVSLIVGPMTRYAADSIKINSADLSDQHLIQVLRVTGIIRRAWSLIFLAGFGLSIWIMVIGQVTSFPVEAYWLLPLSTSLYNASNSIDARLLKVKEERYRIAQEKYRARLESERQHRCVNLTDAQRNAYEFKFLQILYSFSRQAYLQASLWSNREPEQVYLSEIRSKLKHECEPELLSVAMQNWIDRKCITVKNAANVTDPKQLITLLKSGRDICIRAESTDMATALRDHERCLKLSDSERTEFRNELFKRISAGTRGGSQPVHQNSVQLNHPCALELMDTELKILSNLDLIDFTALSGISFSRDSVRLTEKGKDVVELMENHVTLENALNEYNQRHRRCLEATSLQRVEFEDLFLQALYLTTSGDTRTVELGDVWKRLNHECFREMTPHALRVWHERKCIILDSHVFEKNGQHNLMVRRIGESTDLSLTAEGRDLCMRSIILNSMQEALSEQAEGYRVKHEYHVHNSQVGAVGPDAEVHDSEFAQFINTTDQFQLGRLAQELTELRDELLRREAISESPSPEHYAAIGAVAEAEVAARDEDAQRVWQHLAKVGRWVLDTANEIGKSLAVEAIKAVFKAYNIPM